MKTAKSTAKAALGRKYIPPPADNERDALLIIYRKCPREEKRTASYQLAAHMRQTYWETAN